MIHTVKGFGIVNKAEIDIFSGTLFFDGPRDVGNLISVSSAFSKPFEKMSRVSTGNRQIKGDAENFKQNTQGC